jgi:NCAIR mutase (PurE)-related protein
MNVEEASKAIGAGPATHETQEETLASFANLDYERSKRTGFPEAVFAEGKTSKQVASILDDMARSVNESMKAIGISDDDYVSTAILATRYVEHLVIYYFASYVLSAKALTHPLTHLRVVLEPNIGSPLKCTKIFPSCRYKMEQ